jgi:formylglycine-generating enzyme required for sulfatase activity/energy-coupling factor transporter ATP-binding protein EcfA2
VSAAQPRTAVRDYLRQVVREIGELDLGLVARRTAPLEDLYAEAPSSLDLSIEVADLRPTRWALGGDSHTAAVELNRYLRDLSGEAVAGLAQAVIDRIDASRRADLQNPYSRPVIETPLWEDGIKHSEHSIPLVTCVGLFPRLIVTGPPGSGKSTFAKYLALALVKANGDGARDGQLSYVDLWTPRPGLPLFVELRAFVAAAGWPDRGTSGITADSLVSYLVKRHLPDATGDERREFARSLLDAGPVIVLDGIDEVRIPEAPDGTIERRSQIEFFIDQLRRAFPDGRIVMTSRDYAYSGWEIPQFTHVHVGRFGDEQIAEMARRLLAHVSGLAANDVEGHVATLIQRMKQLIPEDLRWRPLFVSLLAGVYSRRITAGESGLPATPTQLLEESVALMLDRWTRSGREESLVDRLGCTVGQLREQVDAIAYAAQKNDAEQGDESKVGFPDSIILRELVRLPGRINNQELIGYLQRDTGLILTPGEGRCVFAHRSFQEYLAAHHIFQSEPGTAPWATVTEGIATAPMVWREPLRMLGLLLVSRNRIGDMWGLVDSLLGTHNDAGSSDDLEKRWWLLWLASSYVEMMLAQSPAESHLGRLVVGDLVAAIDRLPAAGHVLPDVERSQLRTTLGKLRKITGSYPSAAAISWCEIPVGEFWMGLDAEDADEFMRDAGRGIWLPEREVPGGLVDLPGYSIARYLVSRAEFAEFINADDGYYCDANWIDAYVGFRHSDVVTAMTDPQGESSPAAPRSEVTWYECMAYCAWVSRRLELPISLPTEAQWEKAARGLDRRMFPWGRRFVSGQCNSVETGFGDVSPPGVFDPTGGYWGENSPADMAGNVWEWCTTLCEVETSSSPSRSADDAFHYPYSTADEREDLLRGREWMRVVRGGAYLSPPHHLMTTFRGRDCPDVRLYRHGFRLVAQKGGA